MKISIVTGAWGRYKLLEFFCKYYKDIKEKIDFELIVACSEKETARITKKHGHTVVNIPNQPLYAKFNAAEQAAKGSDYVINIGSDDFISEETLLFYKAVFEKGFDYVYTLDWYFLDTKTKKGLYWAGYNQPYNKGKACGAGRALSKNILDKMKWSPWVAGYDRQLDTGMQKQLDSIKHTEYGFKLRDLGLFALDIKSEQQMTPFEKWPNSFFFPGDGMEMLQTYLPQYADEIFKL